MNEKEIETIKEIIKVYRARLAGEKRRFGGYFDNGGIRYVIPELYLKLKDYKGALSYYRWFNREFPGDSGFAAFNLLCALTLFQNKKIKEAIRMAYKTGFSNIYLIDLLCKKSPVDIDRLEHAQIEDLEYAKKIVEGYEKLVTKEFRDWICLLNENEEFKSHMKKYVSIQKLLSDEPQGQLRSYLIDEASALERLLTNEDD
jgi:hypothetical protein